MNGVLVQRLLTYLSTTECRSVEDIGDELGCSLAEVTRHIEALPDIGIELDEVSDRGFVLKEPLELLDKNLIMESLAPAVRAQLRGLNIESSLDSTNSALKRLPRVAQHATLILAEHQSGGRGRRGRQWHSPFGRNLYLSLGWMFDRPLTELSSLPLVVALATAQALSRAGLKGHQVKWPNDLILDGQKLCGCLVEVQGDVSGPCHAVLGAGINVHMPVSVAGSRIDQPWTDLNSHLPDCSRNGLAVLLIEALVEQLGLFAEQGFTPFQGHWQQMDVLNGKRIDVWTANSSFKGIARGVDDSGALRLDTGKEILSLHSGEASLRKPAGP